MKLLFVVLVALLARAAASDEVSDPDVVVLTASNFDAIVNPEDLILVEFYAPWCGHCKHLAPEYAKAATTLLRNDPPIKLAKVDATQEQSLASKYNVNGYPTLKLFRNGQPTDYNGPREATGIVNYMKKQVGPSTTEVKTIEQAEKVFGNEDEVVIAGFFTSQGTEYKEFRKVADALRDKLKFAHTLDSAVLDKFQYRQAIVLFKPYDERRVTFGGSFSQSAITEWIFKHQLPIAGALTKSNMEFYNRRGLPILKVLIDVDFEHNKKQMDYYLNRLRKVAKEFPEISYTIAEKSQFAEDRDRFALTGKEASAVLIEEISGQRKFKSPLEKFSVENVRQFVSDYSEGKLKPFIKSEPVPEPAKAGEVAVVVGETFNDIVLDTSKDVLIEFYAPWCGHCKSLAPKYEQLAKEFKDVESVVIAKIDATANDWAQSAYRASGYPTIYFAPANNKENPIKYDGEREVAAMKKWIKEKASIKIKGKK